MASAATVGPGRTAVVVTVSPSADVSVASLLQAAGWTVHEIRDLLGATGLPAPDAVLVYDLAVPDARWGEVITRLAATRAAGRSVVLLSPETTFLREVLIDLGFSTFFWRNDPFLAKHLESIPPAAVAGVLAASARPGGA